MVTLMFDYKKPECENCKLWEVGITKVKGGVKINARCISEEMYCASCIYTPLDEKEND